MSKAPNTATHDHITRLGMWFPGRTSLIFKVQQCLAQCGTGTWHTEPDRHLSKISSIAGTFCPATLNLSDAMSKQIRSGDLCRSPIRVQAKVLTAMAP